MGFVAVIFHMFQYNIIYIGNEIIQIYFIQLHGRNELTPHYSIGPTSKNIVGLQALPCTNNPLIAFLNLITFYSHAK